MPPVIGTVRDTGVSIRVLLYSTTTYKAGGGGPANVEAEMIMRAAA